MLVNIFQITDLCKCNNGLDVILFDNKDSVMDENSFSYGRGTEKRIVYIQHSLYYDGKPFHHHQVSPRQ